MVAVREKTLAHSRNRVIDLSTESGNLFKMAAKTRVRKSGYENLRLVKKNENGGKGELDVLIKRRYK